MISVIIPVGKNDEAWKSLLPDLNFLSAEDEIILVSPSMAPEGFQNINQAAKTTWVQSQAGRAKQMNFGAQSATKEHLWFLHCDSRVSESGIARLKEAIQKNPRSILYFNLKFYSDGPTLMSLNQVGTWFRSRILRLPFGDQGFCLAQKTFLELGGFDESSPYGEDHLLIWRAHRRGVPIYCIGESLITSARKYKERGWLQTTSRHVLLTAKQALPQLLQLIVRR